MLNKKDLQRDLQRCTARAVPFRPRCSGGGPLSSRRSSLGVPYTVPGPVGGRSIQSQVQWGSPYPVPGLVWGVPLSSPRSGGLVLYPVPGLVGDSTQSQVEWRGPCLVPGRGCPYPVLVSLWGSLSSPRSGGVCLSSPRSSVGGVPLSSPRSYGGPYPVPGPMWGPCLVQGPVPGLVPGPGGGGPCPVQGLVPGPVGGGSPAIQSQAPWYAPPFTDKLKTLPSLTLLCGW